MNSPAEDVKDMLEDAGVGTEGTDLFVGEKPPNPDACVVIYNTGGFDADAQHTLRRPTIQVIVRASRFDYDGGYAKIEDIVGELHAIENETWNNTRYIGIFMQGDILDLGYDENDRPEFSVNFRIMRTV